MEKLKSFVAILGSEKIKFFFFFLKENKSLIKVTEKWKKKISIFFIEKVERFFFFPEKSIFLINIHIKKRLNLEQERENI